MSFWATINKPLTMNMKAGVVTAFLAFMFVGYAMTPDEGAANRAAETVVEDTRTAQPAGPRHYRTLLAMSEEARARIGRTAVTSIGEPCPRVTLIRFKGVDSDGAGYFAVGCSNGIDWLMQVANDRDGSITVTDCTVLRLVGVECWKEWSE